MLVFEVLLPPKEGTATPVGQHEFDLHNYSLCVSDLHLTLQNEDGSSICKPTTQFNEFSTLDLHLPYFTTLNLRAWLQRDNVDVEGTDTYFKYAVEGPTEGLKISTVTHISLGVPSEYRDVHPKMHDYRLFNDTNGMFALKTTDGGGVFKARLNLPFDLQMSVGSYCYSNHLNPADCSKFTSLVTDLVLVQNDAVRSNLPPLQYQPTSEAPFVFLHHEKTAGSSLRNYIAKASLKAEVGFYVPCFDGEGVYHEDYRCYSFDLSNASSVNGGERVDLGVMAGHFQWGAWDEGGGVNDHVEPRCFVMIRHPVDRAISLYYERVYTHEQLGGRFLNNLTVEEWRFILKEFRGSAWGMYRDEGFSDSMCKMLMGESHWRGRKPEELDWGAIEGVGGRLEGEEPVRR